MPIVTEQDIARAKAELTPLAVDALWLPLPIDMLTVKPPVRRWLLRHPTLDWKPCPPGQGDGLLPLGKAGSIVAGGGIGKTHALVQLALSVVTGRPWFGHFEIAKEARDGRVLLALAEEDLEEMHRRMFTDAELMSLTRAERELAATRIVVLPLAGHPVSLIAPAPTGFGAVTQETPELKALRKRLHAEGGEHGWSLVALDPLARFAGAETETDNAAATHFVQVVESLVEAPGNPTVLVAHHSSKGALKAGSVDSRGVTGITNGFRWEMTMRVDGDYVCVAQSKSNYSRPMPEEIRLVRGNGGSLRVQTDEERENEKAKEAERLEQQASDDRDELICLIRKHPAIKVTELKTLAGWRADRWSRAVMALRQSSHVIEETGEKGAKIFLPAEVMGTAR